jgi:hypothetical protein
MKTKIGYALAGLAGVGGLYLLYKAAMVPTVITFNTPVPANPPPAPPAPPAPPLYSATSYNALKAVPMLLMTAPGTMEVAAGSSLRAESVSGNQIWVAPGVFSSNTTVVAPSDPPTTNGFVAIAPGTATITGFIWDNATSKNVPISTTIIVASPPPPPSTV